MAETEALSILIVDDNPDDRKSFKRILESAAYSVVEAGSGKEALAAVYRREKPFTRQSDGEATAVDQAIRHCFSRQTVVPERKLITEALKRGLGAVTIEDVKGEVANRMLARREVDGRVMVTLG